MTFKVGEIYKFKDDTFKGNNILFRDYDTNKVHLLSASEINGQIVEILSIDPDDTHVTIRLITRNLTRYIWQERLDKL